MADPDFEERAREWMVRAQGHARPEHVKSLAALLRETYGEALRALVKPAPPKEPEMCLACGRPCEGRGGEGHPVGMRNL